MKLALHHIGKVVKDIQSEYDSYLQMGFSIAPGFEANRHVKEDREQDVLVGAVELGALVIELLEPVSDKSPIATFQKKGGGFHHVCYEVEDCAVAISEIKASGFARQITPVTTSVWHGRPVVFFFNKVSGVFELIGSLEVRSA